MYVIMSHSSSTLVGDKLFLLSTYLIVSLTFAFTFVFYHFYVQFYLWCHELPHFNYRDVLNTKAHTNHT